MKNVLQTVQAVRSQLESGSPNASAERVAEDYARFCAEAVQRLDAAAAMLDKGSDYQALQVAEQEPALLDLVAALSFGGERPWQDFCEEHGLAVAPRLNAKTVHALDALYTKGITANHPLYKDFRAAALSRDDAKSVQILHTILKLNPTDENAKKELQRLDNKQFQEKADQLREALKTDDEERISCLTEELTALGSGDRLQRCDAYSAGQTVRRAWRKRQAEQRLPEMLDEMTAWQSEGDWQAVGENLETWDALVLEHGLEGSDDESRRRLEVARQYFAGESSADLERRSFDKALRDCDLALDEVEMQLRAGGGLLYEEAAQIDRSLMRQWKGIESHRSPAPPELVKRMKSASQALRNRLAGMRRARRLRRLTAAAAVAAALACVTAVILHGWKAHVVSEELASYRTRKLCVPAEDMIRRLAESDDWLTRWPYLQSTIEEVGAWTRQERDIEKQARDAILALESSFAGETSSLAPAQLVAQLEDAETMVRSLPEDLAGGPSNQIMSLRTRIDLHLARVAKETAAQVAETLMEVEQMAASGLSYESPVAKTADNVTQISRKLSPLEQALKPEVDALKIPFELETRILAVRQQVEQFQDDLAKFSQIRAQTAEAGALPTYREALERWKEVRFAEAAAATKALAILPTEQSFLAALLTNGSETQLKAIMEDLPGPRMLPAQTLEQDVKVLLALRDDPYLNEVWENRVADYSRGGGESVWWSFGPLTRGTIGENVRWSGRFFVPERSTTAVSFVKRDVVRVSAANGGFMGMDVLESKPSTTAAFLQGLKLNRMTDADGSRFRISLLELFETIVRDQVASPVAKACVMQRLESILRRRETAWGLHFCPSLDADLREMNQIVDDLALQSEDWLLPSMREKLGAPLAAFFQRCQSRSYFREAAARRAVLHSAATVGVRFGGYVEVDQTLVLNNQARAANELWTLAADDGRPRLLANTGGDKNADAARVKAKASLPLSPVFFLPVDRGRLLSQYQNEMAKTDAAGRRLTTVPFITP